MNLKKFEEIKKTIQFISYYEQRIKDLEESLKFFSQSDNIKLVGTYNPVDDYGSLMRQQMKQESVDSKWAIFLIQEMIRESKKSLDYYKGEFDSY